MSRFSEYLELYEKINMSGTMVGFEVERSYIRRTLTCIRIVLAKNKVLWKTIKNPHISLAQIKETVTKDELYRLMQDIETPIIFKPKAIKIFYGKNAKKYFIVIEYRKNIKFEKEFKKISDQYDVQTFAGGMIPHISLVTIDGDVKKEIFNQIKIECDSLPTIKATNISLFNNKFEVETTI